jgi:hypothetical protein
MVKTVSSKNGWGNLLLNSEHAEGAANINICSQSNTGQVYLFSRNESEEQLSFQ